MTRNLYGYTAANERGASSAEVIVSVENVSGGDTLLALGHVLINRYGDAYGRISDRGTVRLTAADRDRLIDTLSLARSVDVGGAR